MTLEERFWAKVDRTGECWLWTAALSRNGYGRFGVRSARSGYRLAHVVAYELVYGPVPEGRELDHRYTCPKRCIRPDHLRPTTHKQNHENRAGAQVNNSTSGVRGVTWHKKMKKWQAQTKHHGRYVYVGYFDTVEAAKAAVIAKRNELFTHNDRDRERLVG